MIEIAANKALDDQSPNGDRHCPMHAGIQRDRGAALPVPVRAVEAEAALPVPIRAVEAEAALPVPIRAWRAYDI